MVKGTLDLSGIKTRNIATGEILPKLAFKYSQKPRGLWVVYHKVVTKCTNPRVVLNKFCSCVSILNLVGDNLEREQL